LPVSSGSTASAPNIDDGAAIAQIMNRRDVPWTIRDDRRASEEMAAALKQPDAPFGQFGLDTLNADTNAVESDSTSDSTSTGMDAQLGHAPTSARRSWRRSKASCRAPRPASNPSIGGRRGDWSTEPTS